jgi:hypothetical protein
VHEADPRPYAGPLGNFTVATVTNAMMSVATDSLLKVCGSAIKEATWSEIWSGNEEIGGGFIGVNIDSNRPS